MENFKYTVSVILPVYNAEKYLSKTLDSVLAQTYSNMEVIAVNDCSTDSSIKILQEYQKKDNRIKVIDLTLNSGVAVARNRGLDVAKGRYIAFIDSDDVWISNKIQLQMEDLLLNNGGFSYTSIEIVDDTGKLIKKKRKVKRKVTYRYLLKNTIIATSSVLINRDKIPDLQMPLIRSGQDYATWLKILRHGGIALGINIPLVQYRLSPNSLSSNKFKSVKQVWFIQKKYENINFFSRIVNVLFFIINALIKKIF